MAASNESTPIYYISSSLCSPFCVDPISTTAYVPCYPKATFPYTLHTHTQPQYIKPFDQNDQQTYVLRLTFLLPKHRHSPVASTIRRNQGTRRAGSDQRGRWRSSWEEREGGSKEHSHQRSGKLYIECSAKGNIRETLLPAEQCKDRQEWC